MPIARSSTCSVVSTPYSISFVCLAFFWVLISTTATAETPQSMVQDEEQPQRAASDPEEATAMQFLTDYAETDRFRLGFPASIEMTPEGDAIFFLRSGPRSRVRSLYHYDPATGTEQRLLSAEEILDGKDEELTAEEIARRERMRVSARGFASYGLSRDGKHILAPLSGQLFVIDWRSRRHEALPVEGGVPVDPRLSPDGRHVAYSAEGDLWVVPVGGCAPRRITQKEGEHVSYGVPEFAAQEEMDRDQGYWWSPDSRRIAFQRNDDSELPVFYIADPSDPAKAPQSWRYPRAGTTNTDVRLAIVSVEDPDADPVWVRWDREAYPYLATVKWSVPGAPLTILVQDRRQQEQVLYRVDEQTGATTELLRETDEAWLNLDQQMPRWLPGKDGAESPGFLWTTERRGSWQLELRKPDGTLDRVLTEPNLAYTGLVHVDLAEGHVVVEGQPSVLDVQAYQVSLVGGTPRAVTSGLGVRQLWISRNGSLQVLREDPPDAAPRFVVRGADGTPIGKLGTSNDWPAFGVDVEYASVGEEPRFYASIQRPEDFDAEKKYPVIVHVYGGPLKQMVLRQADDKLLDQWLANQGFLVVRIDGRGTPNRGRAWERAIRGNFIDHPLSDQASVLEQLAERHSEMDLKRVGVFGWSFGGYFSAMAVMRRPDLFKAGVAGAPVTEWIDYDTHYTERYVGLPDENPEAYEMSNVLTYAEDLKRPLRILHGTADDNVYFVHGLKMSDALARAGVPHEFFPLASQTHMVADPTYVEMVTRLQVDFFREHLGSPE
ncbi:MAG: S9 family peptidase [Thermoanaerobaculia bacterium]|nr:S9 family peptidase [Thermoanaerobaculia bacterium]